MYLSGKGREQVYMDKWMREYKYGITNFNA